MQNTEEFVVIVLCAPPQIEFQIVDSCEPPCISDIEVTEILEVFQLD